MKKFFVLSAVLLVPAVLLMLHDAALYEPGEWSQAELAAENSKSTAHSVEKVIPSTSKRPEEPKAKEKPPGQSSPVPKQADGQSESIPSRSAVPSSTGCDDGACLWQGNCFPEGSLHPYYNETNCAYGTCNRGEWNPKQCGEGKICCSGQCEKPACSNEIQCSQRLSEGGGCYSLICTGAGSCNASCEPAPFPSRCGQAACAFGSREYCSTGGCNPHADGRCNCDETTEAFPGENCRKPRFCRRSYQTRVRFILSAWQGVRNLISWRHSTQSTC